MSFRARFKTSFSHNDFYHPFLLRQVPAGARRALDVGCGTGAFARLLATRVPRVDAVDRSAEMISAAAPAPGVSFLRADVRDLDLAGYDFISCIASIHHLPFRPTVSALRDALNPGGVLAILGLSRYTPSHLGIDLIAFWPNKVQQLRHALRTPAAGTTRAPVMDAQLSLAEIRAQAAPLLPGAVIRQHLYWRYSLIYRS